MHDSTSLTCTLRRLVITFYLLIHFLLPIHRATIYGYYTSKTVRPVVKNNVRRGTLAESFTT